MFSRFPFFKRKTAMQEIDYRSAILGVFGHQMTARFVYLLRAPHAITHHCRASARTDAVTQPNGQSSGLRRLALFVETEGKGTRLRLRRMVAVGDFGAALNPDNLRNQMQGAIIQGIGGALWEQLQFDSRNQLTRRLSQYRVPRFGDIPDMVVELIDRRDVPAVGAGESPITLPAPAIANALFSATGERKRLLPLAI
jgi:CO/xanthine dehydrogenase Mo-binding subunit